MQASLTRSIVVFGKCLLLLILALVSAWLGMGRGYDDGVDRGVVSGYCVGFRDGHRYGWRSAATELGTPDLPSPKVFPASQLKDGHCYADGRPLR